MEKCDKIVFIGDSITDVAFNRRTKHLKARNAYPAQVAKMLPSGTKCYFKGVASNRSYDVYDRLSKDCIRYQPDLIALLIGVNDAWQQYLPEQYDKNVINKRPFEPHFDEILRRFKMELPSARVIVLTPFVISTIAEKLPFKEFLIPYNNHIISTARGYGYDTIELQSVFDVAEQERTSVELSVDGIHPTELGHSFIAKAVMKIF